MPQQPRQLDPEASPLALFGAELRAQRVRQGLSQARLGRLVHVSGDLLGKIEKAERQPQRDLVDRLDQVLQTAGRLEGLAAAFRGSPLAAPASSVVESPREHTTAFLLRTVVKATRRADHSQQSDSQIATLLGHVRAGEPLLDKASGATQRELASALGEACQLVGWISFDRGDSNGAVKWLSAARAHGERAGDNELLAYVAGPSHGFITTSSGDPAHGLERSYAALGWARRSGNHRLIAFVMAVAARAHARLGEASLCMTMLADAEAELNRHNADQPDPDWLTVFDEAGLEGHRGSCLLDLGQPSLAIDPLAKQDKDTQELFVRNRVMWLLDRAKAYLRLNDVEGACATAQHALDLAGTASSVRVLRRLHALGLTLQTWDRLPEVADIQRRLQNLQSGEGVKRTSETVMLSR